MAQIKLYTSNILDTGTVTVTGSADTGFPKSRLYDRSIDLFWKITATQVTTFHVDQGATGNTAVDFLAIDKHNFNSEDMTWEWSANDSDWTAAVTGWTQGDNLQIIKTLTTSLTKRYWRVTVTSMDNPQCSEIFMSLASTFQSRFDESPVVTNLANVKWVPTVGGLERSTKFGDARRRRKYPLFLDENEGTITTFRDAMDDLDEYSRPFYIKDHDDDYWLCRLENIPDENLITEGNILMIINLLEVL